MEYSHENEVPHALHQQHWTSVKAAISEYEEKYGKGVILPKRFPFEITRSHGSVNWNLLSAWYYNDHNNGMVRVSVMPSQEELTKAGFSEQFTLKDGTKIMCDGNQQKNHYWFEFSKNGYLYKIEIKRRDDKKITTKDLLELAESMK